MKSLFRIQNFNSIHNPGLQCWYFSLLFTGVFQRSYWSIFIGSRCSKSAEFIHCTRGSVCCVRFDRAGMLHAPNKRECHTKFLLWMKYAFTEHSNILIQSYNKIMKLYLKTNFQNPWYALKYQNKSKLNLESGNFNFPQKEVCFHSELCKFIACANLYSFIIILLELWTFSLHMICTWI